RRGDRLPVPLPSPSPARVRAEVAADHAGMRRSGGVVAACTVGDGAGVDLLAPPQPQRVPVRGGCVAVDLTGGGVGGGGEVVGGRSEEHTSELQSREKLVCRLL